MYEPVDDRERTVESGVRRSHLTLELRESLHCERRDPYERETRGMRPEHEAPIACTLNGATYRDRLASITRLADDGLLSHERRDLVLELRYRRSVADRVRDLVAQEQECCAFLRFDTEETADEVRVTISAPERARA